MWPPATQSIQTGGTHLYRDEKKREGDREREGEREGEGERDREGER